MARVSLVVKILTISNCPLDRSLGSGAMILGYADKLRAAGHEVVLLGPEHYEWWPRVRSGKRLRMLFGYTRGALRAVRGGAFDVVEFWGAESWWAAKRLARRASRPRMVARSNGLEPHFVQTLARHGLSERAGFASRCFDGWQDQAAAFREVDGLTTVSDFDRRYALAQGYQPDERLLTLENPLPDDWLGRPFVEERPRTIGFLGGSVPNKGGALLVKALVDVLQEHPSWRARFVGGNEIELRKIFSASLASQIEVLPFVRDRKGLMKIYDGLAVVAMPSAYESFGMVAAEALACGCALVASDTGFAADLRSEVEVVRVAERSPSAWSTTLRTVLGDEERRRRIARGGWARVQSLRWADAVARLEEFYRKLLASGSGAGARGQRSEIEAASRAKGET